MNKNTNPQGTPSFVRGNQINWNHVFYFSEVASLGSLKEAATKLGLSASTVSEHISQLERDLDVQLFSRHHRKLELTERGVRLFRYAKQMFEAGQRLIDVVSPIPLGCYPIAIGLVSGPCRIALNDLIVEYVAHYNPHHLKLQQCAQDELERGLSEAKYDFGFSYRAAERRDVVSRFLSRSKLVFFVNKALSQKTFGELAAELPLVLCSVDLGWRSLFEHSMADFGFSLRSTISLEYAALLSEICKRGLGVGVLSEDSFRRLPSADIEELFVLDDSPDIPTEQYVLWPVGGENSEAVKQLIELLPN